MSAAAATPQRNTPRGPAAPLMANGGPSKTAFQAQSDNKAGYDRIRALQGPPSPTHSARSVGTNVSHTTRASRMEWTEAHRGPDVIITRADIRNSLDTYERLLNTAKVYRNAMMALASATSGFASALEDCARQKGAAHCPPSQHTTLPTKPGSLVGSVMLDAAERRETGEETISNSHHDDFMSPLDGVSSGEKLLSAAGLHHVMSNQQQLLSDTFYKSFEIPLIEKFDNYKAEVADRQLSYEKETEAKTKKIRDTEAENMRIGRKKQRDLASFRKALMQLQMHVDELDKVKAEYYYEVLDGEVETWDNVSGKVALVVRSQVDSADRIVSKSTSDPTIEGMVQTILDPFNAYQTPDQGGEGHLFSILQPLSLSSSIHTSPGHPISSFARTRTSTATQMPSLNAAQDPQLDTHGTNNDEEDTPKRQHGKDKSSWISERTHTHTTHPHQCDDLANDHDDAFSVASDKVSTHSSNSRISQRAESIPGLDNDTARWQ